jgi:predicted transcriptional regulator
LRDNRICFNSSDWLPSNFLWRKIRDDHPFLSCSWCFMRLLHETSSPKERRKHHTLLMHVFLTYMNIWHDVISNIEREKDSALCLHHHPCCVVVVSSWHSSRMFPLFLYSSWLDLSDNMIQERRRIV